MCIRDRYDATEVILNVTVDESLLSGYVLQVGDRVFDNSGRHQLDKMMEGKPSLATLKTRIEAVSYTHLAVYKRQVYTVHGHAGQWHPPAAAP